MSILDIITLFAYSCALIGILFSRKRHGKDQVVSLGDLDPTGKYCRKGDAMTELEQRLRNETGRLTRALQDAGKQRKEMQADLIWHRDDITDAIELLQSGMTRDAIQVLQASLDRRNRTREQRKVKQDEAI